MGVPTQPSPFLCLRRLSGRVQPCTPMLGPEAIVNGIRSRAHAGPPPFDGLSAGPESPARPGRVGWANHFCVGRSEHLLREP